MNIEHSCSRGCNFIIIRYGRKAIKRTKSHFLRIAGNGKQPYLCRRKTKKIPKDLKDLKDPKDPKNPKNPKDPKDPKKPRKILTFAYSLISKKKDMPTITYYGKVTMTYRLLAKAQSQKGSAT